MDGSCVVVRLVVELLLVLARWTCLGLGNLFGRNALPTDRERGFDFGARSRIALLGQLHVVLTKGMEIVPSILELRFFHSYR